MLMAVAGQPGGDCVKSKGVESGFWIGFDWLRDRRALDSVATVHYCWLAAFIFPFTGLAWPLVYNFNYKGLYEPTPAKLWSP